MPGKRRVIGVDESGKGDFFGPLVVAAFISPDSKRDSLQDIGVRDGKRISEGRILQIDKLLRETYPHAIIMLDPESYNKQYAEIRNLNKLLAEGHARAIDAVLEHHEAELAVSDKFGKPELVENALMARKRVVNLRQLVRGERIIQVAAASILARAAFIREIRKLSEQYGVDIPRGAVPNVDQVGRRLVQLYGPEVLFKLAKTHFKNYQRVVNPSLFTI